MGRHAFSPNAILALTQNSAASAATPEFHMLRHQFQPPFSQQFCHQWLTAERARLHE